MAKGNGSMIIWGDANSSASTYTDTNQMFMPFRVSIEDGKIVKTTYTFSEGEKEFIEAMDEKLADKENIISLLRTQLWTAERDLESAQARIRADEKRLDKQRKIIDTHRKAFDSTIGPVEFGPPKEKGK